MVVLQSSIQGTRLTPKYPVQSHRIKILPSRPPDCVIYRAGTRTHFKLQTSSEMHICRILYSQEERHDRHEVRMRENKRERSRAGEKDNGDRYHGAQPVKVASHLHL